MKFSRRTVFLALTVALIIMLVTGIVSTLAGANGNGELLKNGDFENGFRVVDNCGMVGVDWGCFNTGGIGGYGFYDDQWERVVASGSHAQMIEINTKQEGGDQNRTAGIYQVVNVVPGETYTLSFKGMIRANDFDSGGDPWRYVMLVGFNHNGSTNWADAQVQEVNVGPIQDRVNPSGYYDVKVDVTAQSSTLTVFIAGRMKWGDWYKEVDFNIDAASLKGAVPGEQPPPTAVPPTQQPPATAVPPTPAPPTELVCDGPNLLLNPGFEEGFDPDGTATKWGKFNNGGRANYGYYDEQWGPVVAEGAHAQLLEINTYGHMPTDPDRWIGIHQQVDNLTAGATYQLSLKAMIREAQDHSDEDAWRYEVYWGVNDNNGKISQISELESLTGIPVSGIYLRTAPGPYTSYMTTFQAPASTIRLYLLGLKKWAQSEREVNFDFDAVELRACREVSAPPPAEPYDDPPANSSAPADNSNASASAPADNANASAPAQTTPVSSSVCTYLVQPGDYISLIAEQFGVTVEWLMTYNNIANPNLLFVGQPLLVPCQVQDAAAPQEQAVQVSSAPASNDTSTENDIVQNTDDTTEEVHVVVRGESLSQIAFRYGTTVQTLRTLNNIKNPRLIRPGQVIQLPSQ